MCLYKFEHRRGPSAEWFQTGKARGHRASIVGLAFSDIVDLSDQIRLYSLGEDRKLVEYDVTGEQSSEMLVLTQSLFVEQEARPSGLLYLRALSTPDDPALLVLNDEYKFKVWKRRGCLSTSLAPTYGGALCQMVPVSREVDDLPLTEQFLLYATEKKVVGLVQMPLDGNPYRYMGLIAHPGQISSITVDYQGRRRFRATCRRGIVLVVAMGTSCGARCVWGLWPVGRGEEKALFIGG